MRLTTTIKRLLKDIGKIAKSGGAEFSVFSDELKGLEGRLEKPLNVAVVGIMKAGKSTLMNAILKEKVLFTGTLETTYTVTWFKYGDTPRLTIVFKDGKEKEAPFEDLEKWTVRPKDLEVSEIDKVWRVIVYYPNDILKEIELIDTPGMNSTHKVDSQNTQDLIEKRLIEDAEEATLSTAAQAEAVVYAFSRGVQAQDAATLEDFHRSTNDASPINAIGVFTKADTYWDCAGEEDADPLEIVREACGGYQRRLKNKLYRIFPVVAKAVEAVSDMGTEEFDILSRLSDIGLVKLARRLSDAYDFSTSPEDSVMSVSAEDRARVLELYGQYGIYSIAQAIQNGVTVSEMPDFMYERSGVAAAANSILRHFGNRAALIKTDYVLKKIEALASDIKLQNPGDTRITRVCDRVKDDIDKFRSEEQAFQELELLQSYYKGDFALSEEDEKEFLEVLCENGSDCRSRLGFTGITPIPEMRNRALSRVTHWSKLMNDYNIPPRVSAAAEIIVRSLETMYYHLDALSGYNE